VAHPHSRRHFFRRRSLLCRRGREGRELVAQDFVYSILRIADVKVGSGGYWAFRGKIAGLDEFREASRGADPTDYARRSRACAPTDRTNWKSA
jgi:hypothetical protein